MTTGTPAPQRSFALRVNLWLLALSRHWLRTALIVLGIYITLPWVAPTLMHFGITGPARVVYFIYGPFCHQFAFRSFFLYGEQPIYPRSIANTPYTPYEDYIDNSPEFDDALKNWVGRPQSRFATVEEFEPYTWSFDLQFASKDFFGTPEMGYKTTLCMRDIAIYTAMWVFGLVYSHPKVRRRLRPIPIWLYVFAGVLPIAIDGFSQLLGYPPISLWEPRETGPVFRVVTGAVFGLATGWLAFPYLEQSFVETRIQLEAKLRKAGIPV